MISKNSTFSTLVTKKEHLKVCVVLIFLVLKEVWFFMSSASRSAMRKARELGINLVKNPGETAAMALKRLQGEYNYRQVNTASTIPVTVSTTPSGATKYTYVEDGVVKETVDYSDVEHRVSKAGGGYTTGTKVYSQRVGGEQIGYVDPTDPKAISPVELEKKTIKTSTATLQSKEPTPSKVLQASVEPKTTVKTVGVVTETKPKGWVERGVRFFDVLAQKGESLVYKKDTKNIAKGAGLQTVGFLGATGFRMTKIFKDTAELIGKVERKMVFAAPLMLAAIPKKVMALPQTTKSFFKKTKKVFSDPTSAAIASVTAVGVAGKTLATKTKETGQDVSLAGREFLRSLKTSPATTLSKPAAIIATGVVSGKIIKAAQNVGARTGLIKEKAGVIGEQSKIISRTTEKGEGLKYFDTELRVKVGKREFIVKSVKRKAVEQTYPISEKTSLQIGVQQYKITDVKTGKTFTGFQRGKTIVGAKGQEFSALTKFEQQVIVDEFHAKSIVKSGTIAAKGKPIKPKVSESIYESVNTGAEIDTVVTGKPGVVVKTKNVEKFFSKQRKIPKTSTKISAKGKPSNVVTTSELLKKPSSTIKEVEKIFSDKASKISASGTQRVYKVAEDNIMTVTSRAPQAPALTFRYLGKPGKVTARGGRSLFKFETLTQTEFGTDIIYEPIKVETYKSFGMAQKGSEKIFFRPSTKPSIPKVQELALKTFKKTQPSSGITKPAVSIKPSVAEQVPKFLEKKVPIDTAIPKARQLALKNFAQAQSEAVFLSKYKDIPWSKIQDSVVLQSRDIAAFLRGQESFKTTVIAGTATSAAVRGSKTISQVRKPASVDVAKVMTPQGVIKAIGSPDLKDVKAVGKIFPTSEELETATKIQPPAVKEETEIFSIAKTKIFPPIAKVKEKVTQKDDIIEDIITDQKTDQITDIIQSTDIIQETDQVTITGKPPPPPPPNIIIDVIPPPPVRPPVFPTLPQGFFGSAKRSRQKTRQPKGYTPTLFSLSKGITGKATKFGIESGLGIRPLVVKKKKKKKLKSLFGGLQNDATKKASKKKTIKFF